MGCFTTDASISDLFAITFIKFGRQSQRILLSPALCMKLIRQDRRIQL